MKRNYRKPTITSHILKVNNILAGSPVVNNAFGNGIQFSKGYDGEGNEE